MPAAVRLVHLAMIEMMSAAKLVVMSVEKAVRTKKGSVACTIHLTMTKLSEVHFVQRVVVEVVVKVRAAERVDCRDHWATTWIVEEVQRFAYHGIPVIAASQVEHQHHHPVEPVPIQSVEYYAVLALYQHFSSPAQKAPVQSVQHQTVPETVHPIDSLCPKH